MTMTVKTNKWLISKQRIIPSNLQGKVIGECQAGLFIEFDKPALRGLLFCIPRYLVEVVK